MPCCTVVDEEDLPTNRIEELVGMEEGDEDEREEEDCVVADSLSTIIPVDVEEEPEFIP